MVPGQHFIHRRNGAEIVYELMDVAMNWLTMGRKFGEIHRQEKTNAKKYYAGDVLKCGVWWLDI